MNPISAIAEALAGFLKAANAILSVVPGLVWALLLAAALTHSWWVSGERDAAEKERDVVKVALATLTRNVETMKREARDKLAVLTAERDRLQAAMNDARRAQEIKDGNNQAAVDKARADLRNARAAHGGQLRDPNAAGCRDGGGSTQGGPGAGAGPGAPGGAEAGGLFSAGASELLERLTREADEVNRAYASCRADAYRVRGLKPPAGDTP